MRAKRIKVEGRPAVYHLISRTVAGEHLLDPKDQEVLRRQIHVMAAFCGIEVLTYCILSNHFHLLVRVPAEQTIADKELVRRYDILYGPDDAKTLENDLRSKEKGEILRRRLHKRMHDISFFMKELKLRFTIYFNETHDRFGTLWAERFKSLLVESKGSRNAVLAVAAYIDLNPVRAGLCQDPKEYRFCGYAEAVAGNHRFRKGLSWVTEGTDWRAALAAYRMVLFGTGATPARAGKKALDIQESQKVLAQGGKLGLPELLRCRIRYFSDGLAFGSARFVRRFREATGAMNRQKWEPPGFSSPGNGYFARRQKGRP